MIKITRPACPEPARLTAGIFNHPNNKAALIDASSGKCMYCEAFIRHTSWGEVEHIRPKSTYPLLEFIWENLGFVCQRCNNAKGDKFDEGAPYINPYEDEPSDFLTAQGAIVVEKESNVRGQKTVSDIELNREELVEKRYEAIQRIQKIASNLAAVPEPQRTLLLDVLREETAPDKEFSFVVKQLF